MTAFAKSCGGYRTQARGRKTRLMILSESARSIPPVIPTIVMLRLFARRQRASMSVYFTNSLTPPTGLGLLGVAPRRGFPVGQRVARSLPERWPAVRPRGQEALAVQGHRLALGGQPGRCPFTRPLDFSEHQDAWTQRHCRPLCRELINRM